MGTQISSQPVETLIHRRYVGDAVKGHHRANLPDEGRDPLTGAYDNRERNPDRTPRVSEAGGRLGYARASGLHITWRKATTQEALLLLVRALNDDQGRVAML